MILARVKIKPKNLSPFSAKDIYSQTFILMLISGNYKCPVADNSHCQDATLLSLDMIEKPSSPYN